MRSKLITDHIFTIRQIMEKFYEFRKEIYIRFVDLKQANGYMKIVMKDPRRI